MDSIDKKIQRLRRIPGVINWARQNFPRTDETKAALRRLADAEIQISLGPIYTLCQKLAYREISYEEALEKAEGFEGRFYREAGEQILPLFEEYVRQNQDEALEAFRKTRVPFPIGKNPEGNVAAVPVKPTYVTIREGQLRPVFLLGWVDSPLTYEQRRLICAVIRRALLTQQDFIGCEAEIVTFPRYKGSKTRYQGGWLISSFSDMSDDELREQISIYNRALSEVVAELIAGAGV